MRKELTQEVKEMETDQSKESGREEKGEREDHRHMGINDFFFFSFESRSRLASRRFMSSGRRS